MRPFAIAMAPSSMMARDPFIVTIVPPMTNRSTRSLADFANAGDNDVPKATARTTNDNRIFSISLSFFAGRFEKARIKRAWQQVLHRHRLAVAAQIRQHDLCVPAKLPDNLPASAARRR